MVLKNQSNYIIFHRISKKNKIETKLIQNMKKIVMNVPFNLNFNQKLE